MPNNAVVSCALLSTLWERERKWNYLDIFLPFVATLWHEQDYRSIPTDDLERVLKDFEERFGLSIPYHPMQVILNRSVAKELLIKEKQHYRANQVELEKNLLSSDAKKEREGEIDDLCERFAQFVERETGESIGDRAIDIVLGFLEHRYADLLIFAREHGVPPDFRLPKKFRKYSHLFNRFIVESDSDGFDVVGLMAKVSWGYALFTIIRANWTGLQEETLRDCRIYLDTRIILRLMGMEGINLQQVYEDLCRSLTAAGANLLLFRHTKEEIDNILDAAQRQTNRMGYSPHKASRVMRHFREEGYGDIEIGLIIGRLNGLLSTHAITIKETPNHTEDSHSYQIDERQLEQNIQRIYRQRSPYINLERWESAIRRDVKSISTIYLLRKGKRPTTLRKARYFFVTTNGGLAQATREYNQKNQRMSYLYECITDIFLSTALWIISSKQVVDESALRAYCSQALKPDEAFYERFYEKLDLYKKEGAIDEADVQLILANQHGVNEFYGHAIYRGEDADVSDYRRIVEKIRQEWLTKERKKWVQEHEAEWQKVQEDEERRQQERDSLLRQQTIDAERAKRGQLMRDRLIRRATAPARWIIGSVAMVIPLALFLLPLVSDRLLAWPWVLVAGIVGIEWLIIRYGRLVERLRRRIVIRQERYLLVEEEKPE